MTIYTSNNTQPGTKVIHEGQHITYVEQVDTETNTLTICDFPLTFSVDQEFNTNERKFTSIEVLPGTDLPNLFICHGEIL